MIDSQARKAIKDRANKIWKHRNYFNRDYFMDDVIFETEKFIKKALKNCGNN